MPNRAVWNNVWAKMAHLRSGPPNFRCGTACPSGPLAVGRMIFLLWTMDCKGTRGEGNQVVTTRQWSSQDVFGPKNRGFPALRANGLPPNCADQGKVVGGR